jgi:hypothetical protein
MSRLFRGLSFAFLEQLRSGAVVANAVADEVFRRTGSESSEPRFSAAPKYRARQSVTREQRFSDEGFSESTRSFERERQDVMRRGNELAEDLLAGIFTGLHESIEVPRRVVERFQEAFHEPVDAEPSSRAAGTRSERSTKVEQETQTSGTGRTQVKKETESYKSETKKS